MAKCSISGKEYNPETVDIPNPLPDNVCGICGSELTEEQLQAEKARMEAIFKELEDQAENTET